MPQPQNPIDRLKRMPYSHIEYGKTNGCYSIEMSSDDYHLDRHHISSSGCKVLLRSPAHFQAYRNAIQKEPTAPQRLGSALHCAVLEHERFEQEYIKFDGDRRGSAWTSFKMQHSGKEVLNTQEWQAVSGMRDAIEKFQMFPVGGLVRGGSSEKSIFFEDEETSVPCKIRCDSVNPHLILDLKTTDDARDHAFVRQTMKLQYDLQAAMYVEGCRHFFGRTLPFYFVVVETHPPFGVMVHKAGESVIEIGFRKWRKSLELYKSCMDANAWPSYADPLSVLELPHWAQEK